MLPEGSLVAWQGTCNEMSIADELLRLLEVAPGRNAGESIVKNFLREGAVLTAQCQTKIPESMKSKETVDR